MAKMGEERAPECVESDAVRSHGSVRSRGDDVRFSFSFFRARAATWKLKNFFATWNLLLVKSFMTAAPSVTAM